MINDWKYCIVQMPLSCFCPSCFTQYRGPTGTTTRQTHQFFLRPRKKIRPRRFQNWKLACPWWSSSEKLHQNTTWSLGSREVAVGKISSFGIDGHYSGSLLFVVLSQSMLSSLCVGEGRAPVAPAGRILSPWKRRHSGQIRMWLHPLATRAASCANLWERGSGSPVPPHSLPLLRLTAAALARRSSRGSCRGRSIEAARRRLTCRLSWHMTIPWSSRSISSHTDCCKHKHREKKIGERGIREGEKEGDARQLTDWLTSPGITGGQITYINHASIKCTVGTTQIRPV